MHVVHDEIDLRLEVIRHERAADDVVVLELGHSDGSPLPVWSPGAHIDLLLPAGLERQYSLCGDPGNRSVWRIGVLREPDSRGGSHFVHDRLRPGDVVDVRGPRNNFELVEASRYVFIAGGIGITPLLPMAAAASAAGASWEMHYGGRALASMAFGDELVAEHGDRVRLHPQDREGLLDLESILDTVDGETRVYCCGPEALLTEVERQCTVLPPGTLHLERFAPKKQGDPARSGSFEVELAQSGRTLTVAPEQSVLEAVEAAGITVMSSCQEGTCGSCETSVVSGEVDHRDSLLTPAEQATNDTMFICVSRAACPRLVLDL